MVWNLVGRLQPESGLRRLRLILQDVADLREQLLRLAGSGLRVFAQMQTGQHLDHPEDGKTYDNEVDDCVDENPKVERRCPRMLGICQSRIVLAIQREEHVGEIDAADYEAENGIDHVLYEAAHDAREGGTNDDTHGEIHHAATHDEGAELADP